MNPRRIYLDHAATSWPKPTGVLEAMDEFARECGAAAGRGSYRSAAQSAFVVNSLRREIATRIVAPSPTCISLHCSGTAALNAAVHGLLRPGDHVVTTVAEHNSILRPLHFLQQRGDIQLSLVTCDANGCVAAEDVLAATNPQTKLVAVTHASNVTGAVQPIEAIANQLKSHRALLLCDAAQTFGYLPIDVSTWGIDLLAAPGHKGGGGPLGTGFLFVSPDCQDQIASTIQGGTGSQSESLEMPSGFPEKLEAGNLNVPACAGWVAGLRQLTDPQDTARRCRDLAHLLHGGLRKIEGLHVYGDTPELPIASVAADFAISGVELSPSDLAGVLDVEFGIETRAGLHCAALIHQQLGSWPDGTLRISAGLSTTEQEIEAVIAALQSILKASS